LLIILLRITFELKLLSLITMHVLGNIRKTTTTTVGVNRSLSFAAYSAGWGASLGILYLTELAYQ